jgi:hypothetical protein
MADRELLGDRAAVGVSDDMKRRQTSVMAAAR